LAGSGNWQRGEFTAAATMADGGVRGHAQGVRREPFK
jgi:hypothetical protein